MPLMRTDDLSSEVWRRLKAADECSVADDPLVYVERLAREVDPDWETRGLDACSTESIQTVIGSLPPAQRELLRLHVRDGLSYLAIGRITGYGHEMTLDALIEAYVLLAAQP